MKIKLLFQGDSITDRGRNRDDCHDMGPGYASFASKMLAERFPEVEFEFINLGIGGNRAKELAARLQTDFLDVKADVVSVLVGVNDIYRRMVDGGDQCFDRIFEDCYEKVMKATKENGAKLMVMEPFLINTGMDDYHLQMFYYIQIIRRLAKKYADVIVPLEGLVYSHTFPEDWKNFSEDGIHPNDRLVEYLAKVYVEYMSPLVEKIIREKKEKGEN